MMDLQARSGSDRVMGGTDVRLPQTGAHLPGTSRDPGRRRASFLGCPAPFELLNPIQLDAASIRGPHGAQIPKRRADRLPVQFSLPSEMERLAADRRRTRPPLPGMQPRSWAP